MKNLALVLCLVFASTALAQPASPPPVQLDTTLHVPSRASLPTAAERLSLRRGRSLLAVGGGLLAGGLLGVIASLRGTKCDIDDPREHNTGWGVAGGVFMGLGLAFTLGGSVRVRQAGHREIPWHPGLVALALGTAVTATGLWFAAGVDQWVGCISS